MHQLIIKLQSLCDLTNDGLWGPFFVGLEKILNSELHCLDNRDPVRRKVSCAANEGLFVTTFGPKEYTRGLNGIYQAKKAEIAHFRLDLSRPNSTKANLTRFNLYIETDGPLDSVAIESAHAAFRISCQQLKPFWAVADITTIINSRKSSPPNGTLYYERELNGIFWLTYISQPYVDFFGKDKVMSLPGAEALGDGVLLKLADSPFEVTEEQRHGVEEALGRYSFASYGQNKQLGEHVLLFKDIAEQMNQTEAHPPPSPA